MLPYTCNTFAFHFVIHVMSCQVFQMMRREQHQWLGVTFFASVQKTTGDCGLWHSHNSYYLIHLVKVFLVFEISYFLLQIGTHLQCNCVPNCNKLLQIGTHLQCNCVPICNKLLQVGTHLHCIFVPNANKIWWIVTSFGWYAENTSDRGVTLFVSEQQSSGNCDLNLSWKQHIFYYILARNL